MSTSSINNGSQGNSDIEVAAAVVPPQVHFAEETLVAEAAPNPDGDRRRRHRHHRRTDQRATSIEVEFSNEFAVSLLVSPNRGTCLIVVLGGKGYHGSLSFGPEPVCPWWCRGV